ncbi:SDR family NAD(P)-dependent oxidoreductase [Streptomyces sp. DHE17-7]|uniref:SDR family NAD(P)-dependent oxidoreductase n=1 Tax=Streptomyces sp. DHE17-7 TaxID=2759949 RepID=UPI0022EB4E45|nr:SDR family NAD(P)-dependent oxidoreductase [Streptomyces sp. DHE17-7]
MLQWSQDTDKIALITGANKGIGFEIARQLGELGITAVRRSGNQQRRQGNRRGKLSAAVNVHLDVNRPPEQLEAAPVNSRRRRAPETILRHNAGGHSSARPGTPTHTHRTCPIYDQPNVFGVVTVTNAMLPLLRKSPAARIVNQSSELGSKTQVMVEDSPLWPLNNMPYNSSKAALNMITVTYAKELWGTPIKVNALRPHCNQPEINKGKFGSSRPPRAPGSPYAWRRWTPTAPTPSSSRTRARCPGDRPGPPGPGGPPHHAMLQTQEARPAP